MIARGRNVMAGYWEDEGATAQAIRDGWFHTGDLGRFDDEGEPATWSGRSKDVIVDANGKNVYPDEIEDLYRESPFIKELSVVGVPDGIGEQVACAVVAESRARSVAVRRRGRAAKVEEHFRKVSADLPIWKRVRSLHVWEGDLPKTAKRSIKRREVAAEIARLRRKNEETKGALGRGGRARAGRLAARDRRHRVGAPAGRRAAGQPVRRAGLRQPDVRGAASALENAGVALPESVDVTRWARSPSCRSCWRADRSPRRASGRPSAARERGRRDPRPRRRSRRRASAGSPGRSALFYERVLDTR